ncbi:hypothetical protein PAQ31011_00830 [Pandoraea aquatica]|uniref:Uncharacterized protein n=2 Tax=Pandoraea aquatica TaxID=2508290 RepID=A0A5E4SIS1_9BURK|nr:hypothetical protein PAQ31011_00830 [Pandoraea aquatica]
MRWRDEYSECVGWVLIFAAGVLTAGSFMSWGSKSFWDVATAIGTVGAVLVAVGLYFVQKRDKAAADRLGAAVVGMRVVPQMKQAFEAISKAVGLVEVGTGTQMPSADNLWNVVHFYRHLESVTTSVDRSDLERMAVLEPVAAYKYAQALSIIDMIQGDFLATTGGDAWIDVKNQNQVDLLSRTEARINHAGIFIREALVAFEHAIAPMTSQLPTDRLFDGAR